MDVIRAIVDARTSQNMTQKELAERHIPMTMEDWSKRLDLFLMADDREVHIGSDWCIILLCQ